MTTKEFTESAIALYLEKGGTVHPDITLDICKLIESDKSLFADYIALKKHYPGINAMIGKTVRAHFDLRNDRVIDIAGKCSLIKCYTRFHKKQ